MMLIGISLHYFSDLGFGKLALHLRVEIAKTCDEFTKWSKKTFEEIKDVCGEDKSDKSFPSKVTSAKESILLNFQKWYKRREGEVHKESAVTDGK